MGLRKPIKCDFEGDTTRKFVHYNHLLLLSRCDSWQENAEISHLDFQLEVFNYGFWTIGNQNPLVDNENDLFMHFLAMSCNTQLRMDGCNGKVSSRVSDHSRC